MNGDDSFARSLGNLIDERRQDQGFTQEQLAKLSGISRSTLATVIAGRGDSVSMGNIKAILDVLSIQLDAVPARDDRANVAVTSPDAEAYRKLRAARTKNFDDRLADKMAAVR